MLNIYVSRYNGCGEAFADELRSDFKSATELMGIKSAYPINNERYLDFKNILENFISKKSLSTEKNLDSNNKSRNICQNSIKNFADHIIDDFLLCNYNQSKELLNNSLLGNNLNQVLNPEKYCPDNKSSFYENSNTKSTAFINIDSKYKDLNIIPNGIYPKNYNEYNSKLIEPLNINTDITAYRTFHIREVASKLLRFFISQYSIKISTKNNKNIKITNTSNINNSNQTSVKTLTNYDQNFVHSRDQLFTNNNSNISTFENEPIYIDFAPPAKLLSSVSAYDLYFSDEILALFISTTKSGAHHDSAICLMNKLKILVGISSLCKQVILTSDNDRLYILNYIKAYLVNENILKKNSIEKYVQLLKINLTYRFLNNNYTIRKIRNILDSIYCLNQHDQKVIIKLLIDICKTPKCKSLDLSQKTTKRRIFILALGDSKYPEYNTSGLDIYKMLMSAGLYPELSGIDDQHKSGSEEEFLPVRLKILQRVLPKMRQFQSITIKENSQSISKCICNNIRHLYYEDHNIVKGILYRALNQPVKFTNFKTRSISEILKLLFSEKLPSEVCSISGVLIPLRIDNTKYSKSTIVELDTQIIEPPKNDPHKKLHIKDFAPIHYVTLEAPKEWDIECGDSIEFLVNPSGMIISKINITHIKIYISIHK